MSTGSPRRWLALRLEAPMVSFGGVAIDNHGVTWDFPALSMLTGLFANALGYERTEREAHQALQERIVFASRRDDEPYHGVLRDDQNARVYESEAGWTTRGGVEERNSGKSYGSHEVDFNEYGVRIERKYLTHQRFRDFHPDAIVSVVVTLKAATAVQAVHNRPQLSLDELADALDRPERPLFIGRKPCLPAWPLNAGIFEAETAHDALSNLPVPTKRASTRRRTRNTSGEPMPLLRAQWPSNEGPQFGPLVDRAFFVADRRNWLSGLHGGTRHVVEGRIRLPPISIESAP